jgi:hypothetical protein
MRLFRLSSVDFRSNIEQHREIVKPTERTQGSGAGKADHFLIPNQQDRCITKPKASILSRRTLIDWPRFCSGVEESKS